VKVGFVRIFVSSVQRSLPFYTDTLGMQIDYTDGKNWAQFKSGEDYSLAIEAVEPEHEEQGSKLVGRFTGVTLMVDSIEEAYSRLSAQGVKFQGPPEKQHWGGTLAHIKDPDGNVLTLLQEAG
jgi:catechol 2,3-dioxygenase-like lactoylglutathione lyase family enzyme